MLDAQVIAWIRDKYQAVSPELGERGRRLWAAAETRSLGWGGVTAVARATGISDRTVRHGIQELAGGKSVGGAAAACRGWAEVAGGSHAARNAESPVESLVAKTRGQDGSDHRG